MYVGEWEFILYCIYFFRCGLHGHFISSSIRYPHKTDISVQNGNKRISDDLSYEEYILRGTDQLVHQIVKHKTIYLNVS